jgi:hypothetical protein
MSDLRRAGVVAPYYFRASIFPKGAEKSVAWSNFPLVRRAE